MADTFPWLGHRELMESRHRLVEPSVCTLHGIAQIDHLATGLARPFPRLALAP
jgi:hypothetical protein